VFKIFAGQGNLSFNGWFADFLAPAGFFVALDDCPDNQPNSLGPHAGGFCDAALDRLFKRARALQTSDPEQSTLLWRKVDRELTDQAPWVPYLNPGQLELLSTRVGNYQYNQQWGTLLDQLWVR
jgi:peptide/nickel transport system substrate-binding protein